MAELSAVSLISIPVPPTSVHPPLCGLIGIILGKSSLGFFPGLYYRPYYLDMGANSLGPIHLCYPYRPIYHI